MNTISIESFAARTTSEDDDGSTKEINCRVVGLTKNEQGSWDFLVITNEHGLIWADQRECVIPLEGGTYWPD